MILLHFAAILAIWLITAALIAWSMAASVRAQSRENTASETEEEWGGGSDETA